MIELVKGRFSIEEKDFIPAAWPVQSVNEIAHFLGRNPKSITEGARRLGLPDKRRSIV